MAWLAGCFYTAPINTAPVAVIDMQDGVPPELHKGDHYVLTAAASRDDNGDTLAYTWTLRSCPTLSPCPDVAPFATGASYAIGFEFPDHQPVVATLVVRDPQGAQAETSRGFAVTNRAPELELTLHEGTDNPSGCYTVGRRVVFSASASDADGDPLTVAWQPVTPPGASVPDVLQQGVADSLETYFVRADAPGQYVLHATAADGFDTVAAQAVLCMEADQPPCIEVTDPQVVADAIVIVPQAGPGRSFRVETVLDDLDPFPFPGGSDDDALDGVDFHWSLGPIGAPPLSVPGHDTSDFFFDPSPYAPNDRLALRVEVTDRQVRTPCAADQATCELSPGCRQRLTWNLEVR